MVPAYHRRMRLSRLRRIALAIRLVLLVAFGWSATAGSVHRAHDLSTGHHCAVCVAGHALGVALPGSSYAFTEGMVQRFEVGLTGSTSSRSYRVLAAPARGPPATL